MIRPSRRVAGVDLGVERPLVGVVGGLEDRRRAGWTPPRPGRRCGSSAPPRSGGRRRRDSRRAALSALVRSAARLAAPSTACSVGSGQLQRLAHACPPFDVRVRAHAQVARRARGEHLCDRRRRSRRRAPPGCRSAASPRAPARCTGLVRGLHGRHLVGLGGALDLDAVDLLGARSSPWATRSTIIGQRGPLAGGRRRATASWISRISAWAVSSARGQDAGVEVLALDDQRVPAEALEELGQLLVGHRLVDRRVGDLVAVDVQDRQHRAARRRVQELVRVPGAGGRAGLGLAVADDAGRRSGPGCRAPRRRPWPARSRARRPRGSCPGPSAPRWLGKPPGQEKLLDQVREALGGRGPCPGATSSRQPSIQRLARFAGAPWPGPVTSSDARLGVEDQPVEAGVDQVDARDRPPVAEQAVLDVLGLQRLLEQRVVLQVDHRRRDVVRRAAIQRQAVDAAGRSSSGRFQ